MEEINASGEFVTAEALADPASSTLYGWSPEQATLATDGPYAESKEQLAGFFLIDCETRERAEEIAAHFAQPGGTIELRPAMWPVTATTSDAQPVYEDVWRDASPHVLAALVRRYGDFDACEDAVPGGAARRGPPVAGRRRAGQPARLADHGSPRGA